MAKVLLVEDDNNLREIYQARLVAEGYDIVAAQNGEEALVSAKQNKPDLIISDVMMPRISGFEMLDILRNTDELKHTKVIMLTALGQAEDQARADNLGADKYLVKSQVTLEDIVNAAKELLSESGASVSAPAAISDVPPASPTEPTATLPAAAPAATPEPAAPVEQPAAVVPTPAPTPPAEPVAPASVVPQPNTEVVVPPAPANPTPPSVTVAPLPPTPAPSSDTPVTVQPVEPAAAPAATPATAAPVSPAPAETPAVPSEAAAEASVSESAPMSLEAEEKALEAQIAGFANQQTPAAPAPAAVTADASEQADEASNEQALEDAVEELNGGAEPEPAIVAPSAPATEPTPEPESTPAPVVKNEDNDSAEIAHKKVIRPISGDQPGPSLDELLAKEEAQAGVPPAAPVINGTPASTPAIEPAHKPGQTFDPNSISL